MVRNARMCAKGDNWWERKFMASMIECSFVDFKREILPLNGLDHDETTRETSLEKLASLRPAFREDGTVTAGTSSPMTDGATAVLVASGDFCTRQGLTPLARVKSFAVSGCDSPARLRMNRALATM